MEIYLATSMFESMWSSMTSSMQLAEECMKQDAVNNQIGGSEAYEGIEKFAQMIDSCNYLLLANLFSIFIYIIFSTVQSKSKIYEHRFTN